MSTKKLVNNGQSTAGPRQKVPKQRVTLQVLQILSG